MVVVLANVTLLTAELLMAIANTSKVLALVLSLASLFFLRLPSSNMDIGYLPCELRALNRHSFLDPITYEYCRSLGIIRRPRYVHRSVRRIFNYQRSTSTAIPCIWSKNRALVKPKHQQSDCRPSRSLVCIKMSDSNNNLTENTDVLQNHFALLNCRSISAKGPYLNELITDTNLDMVFFTETWQTPNDFMHLNLLTPNGYQHLSKPRSSARGGGLAVIYRNSISLTQLDFHITKTFEYMVLKVSLKSPLTIILIYRPPKQQNDFFSELSELLTLACALSSKIILLGDFNIHVDTLCSNSTQLKTVLDCFDLHQNVNSCSWPHT